MNFVLDSTHPHVREYKHVQKQVYDPNRYTDHSILQFLPNVVYKKSLVEMKVNTIFFYITLSEIDLELPSQNLPFVQVVVHMFIKNSITDGSQFGIIS